MVRRKGIFMKIGSCSNSIVLDIFEPLFEAFSLLKQGSIISLRLTHAEHDLFIFSKTLGQNTNGLICTKFYLV
jgi:hypothetical protein